MKIGSKRNRWIREHRQQAETQEADSQQSGGVHHRLEPPDLKVRVGVHGSGRRGGHGCSIPSMSEPDVSQLFTVEQAIRIIDGAPVSPRAIHLGLAEAQGHYLAQVVIADRDYPPFDKSLMDGYAVRSADVTGVPVTLKVIGEIAAGQRVERPLEAGQALAIMTGAPLPPGADAVIPVEETRPQDGGVEIVSPAVPHRYIARLGADTREGAVVLRPGARLESAQLAASAT